MIQMLDLLYDEGTSLTLTGGEEDTQGLCAEIYAYAKRKGFLMEVFTNDARGNDCPFSTVATDISLYGPARKPIKNHRRKRRICQSDGELRRLKQAGVMNLKSPILTSDEAEQAAMQKLAAELGLPTATTCLPRLMAMRKHVTIRSAVCSAWHLLKISFWRLRPKRSVRQNGQAESCDTVYACWRPAIWWWTTAAMLPCLMVPLTRQGFAAASP